MTTTMRLAQAEATAENLSIILRLIREASGWLEGKGTDQWQNPGRTKRNVMPGSGAACRGGQRGSSRPAVGWLPRLPSLRRRTSPSGETQNPTLTTRLFTCTG